MSLPSNPSGHKYSFENDVSGRLFCWLIESGQVDFQALVEQAAQGQPDPQSWVKRLADALKAKVGQSWAPPPPAPQPAEDAAAALQGPAVYHLVPAEPLEEDQVQGGGPRTAGLYGPDTAGGRLRARRRTAADAAQNSVQRLAFSRAGIIMDSGSGIFEAESLQTADWSLPLPPGEGQGEGNW